MARTITELHSFINHNLVQERFHLGRSGLHAVLDAGRKWRLSTTLVNKGALIFPHTYLGKCGHQVAAVVHACLDSGVDQVLAIGVLHAFSDEMMEARAREERGEGRLDPLRGIQGPGFPGRQEWKEEFSLRNFEFLLYEEARRRGVRKPQLILRYPFLAGGHPERLPGIRELEDIAKDSVVVATGDLFHHGLGYGESPLTALPSEAGGLELAKKYIQKGLDLLQEECYEKYILNAIESKSDARDVGQVLRYILGPLTGSIIDLIACDTSLMWDSLPPTWVAAALVDLKSIR